MAAASAAGYTAVMTPDSNKIAAIRDAITAALQRVAGRDGLPLYQMVQYHLGYLDLEGRPAAGAGKSLRPIFCCLACEAVSGEWRLAVPAAVALELTHNFSLVHDDIEDGDHERRGRPTIWSRWGVPQAINTGDAVWALAWETLAGARRAGLPADTTVECAQRLATRCREMIEGQYLDLVMEGRADAGRDDYLRIVSGKTGALLACSLELGALCGGASVQDSEAFANAGRLLGIAFQMQDDILGIWGDPAVTGKATDSDVRRRKMALPFICALELLDAESRAIVQEVYRSDRELSDADVQDVLRLFNRAQVKGAAEGLAADYTDLARTALEGLPVVDGRGAELITLATSLAGRRA